MVKFPKNVTSLLFIQGDSTIYAYEITDESPHICPLSHHRCAASHQGLSFLTKNHCDVSSVEFAKAYRLQNTTIEPLSFTVPRIKVSCTIRRNMRLSPWHAANRSIQTYIFPFDFPRMNYSKMTCSHQHVSHGSPR